MRLKKSQVLFAIVLVIIIILILVLANGANKKDDNYVAEPINQYSFGEALNLENEPAFKPTTKPGLEGTDFGDVDNMSEYSFAGEDMIIYKENKQVTVTLSWRDEGYAKYIEKPEFGAFVRAEYSAHDFTARLENVSMSDVKKYIKELDKAGFTKVSLNESGKDYIDFSASNADNIRVIVNYENGIFNITVI